MTTGGTATTAPTAPAASTFQVSPATNIMARPVKAISSPVPRSGCLATSAAGAAIKRAGMTSFQLHTASRADRPW